MAATKLKVGRIIAVLGLLLWLPLLQGCFDSADGALESAQSGPSDPQFDTKNECQLLVESANYRKLAQGCKDDQSMAALAADVQRLFQELDGLIALYVRQFGGGYAPQLDAGLIFESAIRTIRSRLKDIRTDAGQLRDGEWGDVAMYFEDVTLTLKIGDLVDLKDPDEELQLNMNGEWNRVIVEIAGGLAAGLIGLTDWVFAQTLMVDLTDSQLPNQLSTRYIASFVGHNPGFFRMKDPARFDDAAEEIALALSFLAGVTDDVSGWAGLLSTLDEQLAMDSNQLNNLVIVNDVNENVIFDKGDQIIFQPIRDLMHQISYFDDASQISDYATITNWALSRASLDDLTDFGRAVHFDLTGESTEPIALSTYIDSFMDDFELILQDMAGTEEIHIPEPMDWIAIRPLRYFESRLAGRDLLPAVYAINIEEREVRRTYSYFDGTLVQDDDGWDIDIMYDPDYVDWEFMIECELYGSANDWQYGNSEQGMEWNSVLRMICAEDSWDRSKSSKDLYFDVTGSESDPGHFSHQLDVNSWTDLAIKYDSFVWADGVHPVQPIAADDLYPVQELPFQIYFGMQHPSFGGALLVDPDGGSAFEEADNFLLNKTMASIIHTFIDGFIGE